MSNKKIILIIIFTLFIGAAHASQESKYDLSLSRMEREWLNKEYKQDTDETRLSRLEEKVFGTIFENDFNTRYSNLQKAFDAKKQIQNRRNWFEENIVGMPTSTPIRAENILYGNY